MRKPTSVTRRDFLKLSAGSVAALGLALADISGFTKLLEAAVSEQAAMKAGAMAKGVRLPNK